MPLKTHLRLMVLIFGLTTAKVQCGTLEEERSVSTPWSAKWRRQGRGLSAYQIELEEAGDSQQKSTEPPAVKANSLLSKKLCCLQQSPAQDT